MPKSNCLTISSRQSIVLLSTIQLVDIRQCGWRFVAYREGHSAMTNLIIRLAMRVQPST